MLRMKGAPFKSLFVLCRVLNQWQRWDQKPAGCPAVNAPLTDPHLYAKQQLWEQHRGSLSSPKRKKQELEHACEPQWSCMLLSTPQGLEMGTGPERQKHREGRMEDGGWREEGGEPPRNHARVTKKKDCSKYITVGSAHVWQLDDTKGRPSSTSNRDSLRPDWLDGVMSPGTTCSIHQDRHLLGKRIVCFADFCFRFHDDTFGNWPILSALISCPDYTTVKLHI